MQDNLRIKVDVHNTFWRNSTGVKAFCVASGEVDIPVCCECSCGIIDGNKVRGHYYLGKTRRVSTRNLERNNNFTVSFRLNKTSEYAGSKFTPFSTKRYAKTPDNANATIVRINDTTTCCVLLREVRNQWTSVTLSNTDSQRGVCDSKGVVTSVIEDMAVAR